MQSLGQVLKIRLQPGGETPLDAPFLGLAAGGMAVQAHLPGDFVDEALGADLRVALLANQDGRLGIELLVALPADDQIAVPALPVADSKPSSSPFHVIGMTVEVGCRQVCL